MTNNSRIPQTNRLRPVALNVHGPISRHIIQLLTITITFIENLDVASNAVISAAVGLHFNKN